MQLIGTFCPLLTFPLVFVATILASKSYRWWVLFIAPIVAMLPCIVFGGSLAANGNLLFAVILGFAVVGWVVYYAVIIIWRLIKLVIETDAGAGHSPDPAR